MEQRARPEGPNVRAAFPQVEARPLSWPCVLAGYELRSTSIRRLSMRHALELVALPIRLKLGSHLWRG